MENQDWPPGLQAAGPRAAGPSGRRASGPWTGGHRATGLFLAKPVNWVWVTEHSRRSSETLTFLVSTKNKNLWPVPKFGACSEYTPSSVVSQSHLIKSLICAELPQTRELRTFYLAWNRARELSWLFLMLTKRNVASGDESLQCRAFSRVKTQTVKSPLYFLAFYSIVERAGRIERVGLLRKTEDLMP